MKNKKGISHIEIVLSFVLFIGAVFFLIIIFNPIKNNPNKQEIVNILEREIIEKVKMTATIDSIGAIDLTDLSSGETCFCFEYSGDNFVIKNKGGEIKEYDKNGENLCINDNDRDNFYYIYYGEGLEVQEEDLGSCEVLASDKYKFGINYTKEFIFNENIAVLDNEYDESYSNLKNELNIPNFDFYFNFTNSEGVEIAAGNKKKPFGVRVIAKTIPIEMINEAGEISYGKLNFGIW
ncbi:hypothetical protein HYW76_01610 [Candidatus Pacearchaeota archaeon]|nr:hypothetical protein [Candidatus Pacearchaeota archaeon]